MKYSQEIRLDENEMTDLSPHIKNTPPGSYLRCSPNAIRALKQSSVKVSPENEEVAKRRNAMKEAMIQRLENGYSLVRYRVQSGEETLALFRGALLPVSSVDPPKSWPFSSNNGQDYQVFDKKMSIMDIGYSSAWQLGRVST